MYEPKKDIYTILSGIDDVHVYQERPDILKKFPCITFRIENNVNNYTLDKEIAYQNIVVVVDIFAKTSSQSSLLLTEIEAIMRGSDLRLTFASDVPEENLSHITTRFNLIS
jgi:hypothetical protein